MLIFPFCVLYLSTRKNAISTYVYSIKGGDIIKQIPYNRADAVGYAHKWAYSRNPLFYNFDKIGGDCTNFASQVLFAGCKTMNYDKERGWYYKSLSDRSASWTGVKYFADFLLGNKGAGPYAAVCELSELEPGDIIQLATVKDFFHHSPVVVEIAGAPSLDTILVAAHTYDCDYQPLSAYEIKKMRPLHILGCRKP